MKKLSLCLTLGLLLATFGVQAQLYTIDLSTLSSGEYTISNNYTELTGYPSQNIALKVPDGFKIYLKNCTIPETKTVGAPALDLQGDATLEIEGTNLLSSGSKALPAIRIPKNKTLTIKGVSSGTGKLYAWCYKSSESGRTGAAIGGREDAECGNIVIDEYVSVFAYGGESAAGIGAGGGQSKCGNITISNSAVKVYASGGNAIGKGTHSASKAGTVTIAGVVRPNGISSGTYTFEPWDGNLYNVSNEDVVAGSGTTIWGDFSGKATVYIPDGATVTLDNASIINEGDDKDDEWAAITCVGNATIKLTGFNHVKAMHESAPGIYVPKDKTLTIEKHADVTTVDQYNGAIMVYGGSQAPGIGGTTSKVGGNVTIKSGWISATGTGAPAIGGANHWASGCGNITVDAAVTYFIAEAKNGGYRTIGRGYSGTSCGTITIAGTTYADGVTDNPFIYPTPAWDGNLSTLDKDVTAADGTYIYGTLDGKVTKEVKVTIPDGATVYFNGFSIDGDDWTKGLVFEGDATIVLVDETNSIINKVTSAGLFVNEGKTLTIKGTGSMEVTGAATMPGIGGHGNIVIKGGTIIAKGGSYGAGIGAGYNSNSNNMSVTISGGTITAIGGLGAAGIGAAAAAWDDTKGYIGKVTITSDVTKVTATRGEIYKEKTPDAIGNGAERTVKDGVYITVKGTAKKIGTSIKGSLGGDTFVFEPAQLDKSYAALNDLVEKSKDLYNEAKDLYPTEAAALKLVLDEAQGVLTSLWYDGAELDAAAKKLADAYNAIPEISIDTYKACDFTTKATIHNTYTDEWTYDNNWKVFSGMNSNGSWDYVKLGGKSDYVATRNPVYVSNINAFDKEIQAIKVSYVAGSLRSGMSLNEWGVKVYSDAACTNLLYTVKGDNSAIKKDQATVATLVPEASKPWSGGYYFQVYWDVANTGTINGIICVSKIEFMANTATDVEVVSEQPAAVSTKVFRNGQVLILRDGVLYNILGNVVE